MKKSTGFFLGIGAGMAAGAVAGMMAPQSSRRTVKKQVGSGRPEAGRGGGPGGGQRGRRHALRKRGGDFPAPVSAGGNFLKFLKKPLDISGRLCYYNHCSDAEHLTRGYSSAGRALEWHSRGQRFDPAYLHQDREKPWNFGFQGFSLDRMIFGRWACRAQLGEQAVRL